MPIIEQQSRGLLLVRGERERGGGGGVAERGKQRHRDRQQSRRWRVEGR